MTATSKPESIIRRNEPTPVVPDTMPMLAAMGEWFPLGVPGPIEEGTVMSLTKTGGAVVPAFTAYDVKAIGVATGIDWHTDRGTEVFVRVRGVIGVRVCFDGGSIEPGDWLVPSGHVGLAMRARDRYRALGSVVGKALEPCRPAGDHDPTLVQTLLCA